MCGILGLWSLSPDQNDTVKSALHKTIEVMGDSIRLRGPDSSGVWVHNDYPIAFGHRRLAILDLSPTGHQPMHSKNQKHTITFNGEIYNFNELKSTLYDQGHSLRGRSDTEILLELIAEKGIEPTLKLLHGMFAFALWDDSEKTLTLARDRFGEKPLYYGWNGNHFIFGSDLRVFEYHPDWDPTLSQNAIMALIKWGAIDSSHCIYEGIFKLQPGSYLKLSLENLKNKTLTNSCLYWDSHAEAQSSHKNLFDGSFDDAVTQTEALLTKIIQRQLIADVPVGAFLSGGIDSSVVVAIASQITSQPLQTFTMGFHNYLVDESSDGRALATYLKTHHHEHIVTENEALQWAQRMADIYDEPFGDSSAIPTSIMCANARKHVTICLSGDAGDEIFGGYNRYLFAGTLERFNQLPNFVRQTLASTITAVSPSQWNHKFNQLQAFLPSNLRLHLPGTKLEKLAHSLKGKDSLESYRKLLETSALWSKLFKSSLLSSRDLNHKSILRLEGFSLAEQMMLLDIIHYLPDDILTKVDRAAMHSSLETRIPFLDHHLFKFSWSLPISWKIQNHTGKRILREILKRKGIPPVWEKPKKGFGVPLASWLRGPLKDWAQNSTKQLSSIIDMPVEETLWKQHLRKSHDHSSLLWTMASLGSWLNSRYVQTTYPERKTQDL